MSNKYLDLNGLQTLWNNIKGYFNPTIAAKAGKVSGATSGNFAGLDASGNLTDSGSKASDFATSAQGAKADTAVQPAALDDYVPKSQTAGLLNNDGTVDTQTAGKAESALQPKQSGQYTQGDIVIFDANGGLADSQKKTTDFATAAQGTKADNAIPMPTGTDGQILEKDSNETSGVKWVNKPSDGKSAYQLYVDGGGTLSQEAWLASLKANIGAFQFITPTDTTAEAALTAIGSTYASAIGGVSPSQATLSIILLMNDSNNTKTMMIATQDDGSSGFEFVYAGDLQSAMPSNMLTQTNIVNDLTTGGADDVLSAEQGKILEQEVSQLDQRVGATETGGLVPEYTLTGGYINTSGSVTQSDNWKHSSAIALKKGQTVFIKTAGNNITAIAQDNGGGSYTPLVVVPSGGNNSTINNYNYTATSDINVAVSLKTSITGYGVMVSGNIADSLHDLERKVYTIKYTDYVANSYWSGSVGNTISTGSSEAGVRRFSPVPIEKGSRIKFTYNLTNVQSQSGFICDADMKVLKVLPRINSIMTRDFIVEDSNAAYFCMNSFGTSASLEIDGIILQLTSNVETCLESVKNAATLQDVKIVDKNFDLIKSTTTTIYQGAIPKGTKIKLALTVIEGTLTNYDLVMRRNGTAVYVKNKATELIAPEDCDQIDLFTYSNTVNGYINVKIYVASMIEEKINEKEVYLHNVDYKGEGVSGYINYNNGAITTSSTQKYITINLFRGQRIYVESFIADGAAGIAYKVGDGDIIPVVGTKGAGKSANFAFTADNDCLVYVSYSDYYSNRCLITIDKVLENMGLHVNVGNIVNDYYHCQQLTYNAFPDKLNTTTSQVYSLYDALVTQHDRFTRVEVGTASDNQTIYAYEYKPYSLKNYSDNNDVKRGDERPLVFVICGQHGFEKANVMGMYYLIKDILENYNSNAVLGYLHYNVEFKIIPVANPSGFDARTYKNSNGVNLNRNWGVENWATESQDPESSQYGGLAPFDQPETYAINEYYQTFKDRCFLVIDSHTQGQDNASATKNINWVALNSLHNDYKKKFLNAAVAYASTLTCEFLQDYGNYIPNKEMCAVITDAEYSVSLHYGNADVYFMQNGNLALTLEGFAGFPLSNSGVFTPDVQKANAEIICNFLMTTLREYK